MNQAMRLKLTLIPGVMYRVLIDRQERDLVFHGRSDMDKPVRFQWQDPASQEVVTQEAGQPGFEVIRVLS